MLGFAPSEFRKELAAAVESWICHEWRSIEGLVTGEDWKLPDGLPPLEEWNQPSIPEVDEFVITPETEIIAELPDGYETYRMACRHFVELVDETHSASLRNRTECWTPKRILVRVVPLNTAAQSLLNHAIPEPENDEERLVRCQLIAQKEKVAELEPKVKMFRRNDPLYQKQKTMEDVHNYREEFAIQRDLQSRLKAKPINRFLLIPVNCEGNEIEVSLSSGVTAFQLIASAQGCYDVENGATPDGEIFVELRFRKPPEEQQVRNIVNAYLFELAESLKAEFDVQSIPTFEELEENPIFVQAIRRGTKLRPLMVGKGMNEVLELCASAVVATSEFRLIYATKVIEYVAQTVVRKQSFEKIRAKLLSSRALTPDAAFISELQGIISKGEKIEANDGEAIRQTILSCCDATELARIAPKNLTEFKSKNLIADPKIQETALGKFARTLYATRNSIAHAKANYKATGNECPAEHLPDLADCALCAAQQVVRWFHLTPEDIRVVS